MGAGGGHDGSVRAVNLTTWILSDGPQKIGRVVKSNIIYLFIFLVGPLNRRAESMAHLFEGKDCSILCWEVCLSSPPSCLHSLHFTLGCVGMAISWLLGTPAPTFRQILMDHGGLFLDGKILFSHLTY